MGVKLSMIMEKFELNELQTRQFFYGQGVAIDMFTIDPNEEVSREDIEALVRKFGGHPIAHRLDDLLSNGYARHVYWDIDKIKEVKKIANQNPDD